jgi:hypothetical protein
MIIRLLIAAFMLLVTIKPARAVQSTITEANGYSCMGDDKSRKQTEQAAMLDAKKNAAEYTSTYIKSETQVKDYALQKDLVSAYANADVKVIEDLDKEWYKDPSAGDCYKIKIKAEVTPDEKAMEILSRAVGTADQGNMNYPVAPPPIVGVASSPQQGTTTGPDVVVVPSGDTYVYMAPNTTGVYFYGGYWYRYYEGYWFRSPVYTGYWGMVAPTIVPRVVVNVPPEYPRYLPSAYYRIHYADLHQHWQAWDHNHEWHNRDWFKAAMRPDVIAQRQALINQEREQHRVKIERQRQEAKQQYQQQEQQERERQEARQRSLQQKQDRVRMEQKRQIAQQKARRNRNKMKRRTRKETRNPASETR